MKKIALSILAAASALAATPAFAQASGSVDVTGTVAARCTAVTPISGSIALGELAKADGTIDPALSGATNGLTRTFTIRCNGANPEVSVLARPLVNAGAQNSPNGYTNMVHYSASVAAAGAKGGTTTVTDQSLSSGATKGALGDRISASANNVTLTIGNALTSDAAAILEAGTYQGAVEIVVSPAA